MGIENKENKRIVPQENLYTQALQFPDLEEQVEQDSPDGNNNSISNEFQPEGDHPLLAKRDLFLYCSIKLFDIPQPVDFSVVRFPKISLSATMATRTKLPAESPEKNRIHENFILLKKFMETQDLLEWVEPRGGCVCFPRIRKSVQLDTEAFYMLLLEEYKTYTGRGHWFDEDGWYMRIGYSWDRTENLKKRLNNIILAIRELQR